MNDTDRLEMTNEADALAVDGLVDILGIDSGDSVTILVMASGATCEMITAEVTP